MLKIALSFTGTIPRWRIARVRNAQKITNKEPLMNCTHVVLTMPAYVWEALLQRLATDERALFEQKVKKSEFKADKKAIGNGLKKGVEIPGADLKFGDLRLVIS